MKNILLFLFLFTGLFCNSQIINCEEIEYSNKYEDKKYSTYHYVKSSFSRRNFQVFILNDTIFSKVIKKIPKIFNENPKQDVTDFYVLGISEFNIENISKIEKDLIINFIIEINQYRSSKNLFTVSKNLSEIKQIHYFKSSEELCDYMICN